MRKLVLISILGFINSVLLSQQTYQITGKVTDVTTGYVLPAVTVSITINGTTQTVETDDNGFYKISDLTAGKFLLTFSHVGYETTRLPVIVKNNDIRNFNVDLNILYRTGDDFVVSASRRPEKITDAPASIQVIGKKELRQFTGSNMIELLSDVQGIVTMRFGVDGFVVNARGLGGLSHTKAFEMIDGRNTMYAASPGIMLGNNISINKEDVDKIEILIGPQTALYGPNVDNVLINIISKDPRTSPGTTVAMSAGNQSQFSGRFRYATKVKDKWAYKLTGEYAAGKNFGFYDSLMVGGGPMGAFGPRKAIAEIVDHDFRHYRGEAHCYYNFKPDAYMIFTTGGSLNDFAMLSTGGHNQVNNMKNIFAQLRYISNHFYVNVYNVWVNTGFSIGTFPYTRDRWNRSQSIIVDPSNPNHRLDLDSAEINAKRLTNRLAEKNQRFNAEAQYHFTLKSAGLFLVAGISTQLDRPKSNGNTLVDSFERIRINQFGVVTQVEKKLPLNFKFVGAARWDHHTNFNSYFSPNLGIIKKIGAGNLRFTWGKAYSMPTISQQYASNVRAFFGNLEGVTYLPNGKVLADSIKKVTPPLKVEKVSTFELGYKGPITRKIYIDISLYDGLHKDFFNQGSTVLGRAILVGHRAVTHNPTTAGEELQDGTLAGASFGTTTNFGKVRVYGMDLGLTYTFNKFVNFSLKYSFVGSDITKGDISNDANGNGYIGEDEKSLNSPAHRVLAALDFQNLCKQKLFINLSARYISQYDFYGGSQASRKLHAGSWDSIIVDQDLNGKPIFARTNFNWGPLGGFTTFDLGVLYKFNQTTSLGMNITNLFNTEQREAPGSPLIKRLIMFELRMHLPNSSDK